MPISPDPRDLVTVDDVAQWGNMPSAASTFTPTPDQNMRDIIQEAITGWSDFVMWRTGRDPGYFKGDGSGGFTVFNEVRDGNDNDSMGVLNGPINASDPTKVKVQINNLIIPQSTAFNVLGWFVEQNPSFLGLRRGNGFLQGGGNPFGYNTGSRYVAGKGNILISYPGGYNAVPPDLLLKTLKAVMVIVSKRLREDEGARTTPQTGAISNYRTYPWDKDLVLTLANYTRTMLSFGS